MRRLCFHVQFELSEYEKVIAQYKFLEIVQRFNISSGKETRRSLPPILRRNTVIPLRALGIADSEVSIPYDVFCIWSFA